MLRIASCLVASLVVLAACDKPADAPAAPVPAAPAAGASSQPGAPAAPAAGASSQPAAPAAPAAPLAPLTEAPKGTVAFTEPKDGAKVPATFTAKFDVQGLKVRPALEDPNDRASGHHHVVIDGDALPIGTSIPMDDAHKHYGKGQTEAELTLPPGKHKLTLQFADGAHRSYGPTLSQTINIEVAAP